MQFFWKRRSYEDFPICFRASARKVRVSIIHPALRFLQSVNTAQAVEYEIYNLGSLTANGASWAYSINNSGVIVGRAQTSTGSIVACIFDYTTPANNTNLGRTCRLFQQLRILNQQRR
jgi:hypothetical protein